MRVSLSDISWRSFARAVDERRVRELPDDAYERVEADTSFAFWSLTVGDLASVTKQQTPERIQAWISDDLSAYDYIARSKGWKQWIEAFADILKQVSSVGSPTPIEAYINKSQPQMTEEENLLLFTRRYFGLANFTEAEAITLGDYYLARKDDYARRLADRKAYDWREREAKKSKSKGRRK